MLPAESDNRTESSNYFPLIPLLFVFFIIGLINGETRPFFLIYGIGGLMFVIAKLWLLEEKLGLSPSEEIFFGAATGDIFFDFFFWPLMGPFYGILLIWNDLEFISYRSYYRNEKWREFRISAWSAKPETICGMTENSARLISFRARSFDEGLTETAETVLKPAMRVAATGTVAASIAISAHAQTSPAKTQTPITVQATIWTDREGDRQAITTASDKNGLTAFIQSRVSADRKSIATFTAMGKKFSLPKLGISGFAATGPQFNWLTGAQTNKTLFNFSVKKESFVFNSGNWLSRKEMFSGRPLASRHVQNLWFRPLPEGVALQWEGWHFRRKGWGECFVGINLPAGKWFAKKESLFRKLSIFPYRNFIAGQERWDCRATLAF